MSRRKNRRSLSYDAGFDSSALAYFTAGSITDATERVAANTIIVGLKAAGIWDKCDRIYLRSPTSLAAALLCCKTLISQTAVNSPTHSSSGITFNGTTQYCRTGDTLLSGMTLLQTNSGHSSVYFSQDVSLGTTLQGAEKDNFPTTDDWFFLRNGAVA